MEAFTFGKFIAQASSQGHLVAFASVAPKFELLFNFSILASSQYRGPAALAKWGW